MKFKTLAEIDQHYQPQIDAATEEGARYRLMAEKEGAKSAFYEERDRIRDVETARVQAATQYPLAKPELIQGNTREEILASAKGLHDFATATRDEAIAARTQELEQQARQRAYGGGGAGGGGGGGSVRAVDDDSLSPAMKLIGTVQNRLRNGGELTEQQANDFAEVVGHGLFRNQIDGKLPDDWEGTVHVPGGSN